MARIGEIRLRLDHAATRAVVGEAGSEAVQRAADITADRYRANLQADDLVNTGKMLAGVQTREAPGSSELHPRVAIGTDAPYAHFPNEGTRGHGPRQAKVLRFKPKGSSTFVFAKWVRGVRAYRFANRALDALRPTDFTTSG